MGRHRTRSREAGMAAGARTVSGTQARVQDGTVREAARLHRGEAASARYSPQRDCANSRPMSGAPALNAPAVAPAGLSSYQKLIVALIAFLQFTIILDFMVLSPLGALIMPALRVTPSQFGLLVSAYAFSAGLSGLLAAGFTDR